MTIQVNKNLSAPVAAIAIAAAGLLGLPATASAGEWGCMIAKRVGKAELIEQYCVNMESPPTKFRRPEKVETAADAPREPRGSFTATCKSSGQQGWTLRASCKTRSGAWRETSLNFKPCPGHSLMNSDGNLVCGP